VEAQESSKAAKIAYEKFSKEADSHAKEIEKFMALKDEKFAGVCHPVMIHASPCCDSCTVQCEVLSSAGMYYESHHDECQRNLTLQLQEISQVCVRLHILRALACRVPGAQA